MSRLNGTATKKPAASETGNDAAEKVLQEYKDLMLEAGSPNGSWNPEPDQHILGMLRDDVTLSENEIKVINYVKYCCLRQKPTGRARTAWGWLDNGKRLRTTELNNFFGWAMGNTMKYLARPLAYGFIRKDEKTGQLGIGARVQGKYTPPNPKPGTPSEIDLLICTDKLPRYLAEAVCSQLTEPEKLSFLKKWRSIKTDAQQELNAEKQRIYDKEQKQLEEHCKAFRGKLPNLKRKGAKEAEQDAADPDPNLSVQITSVQNEPAPSYKTENGSVPITHIRKQSKAVFYRDPSSSSTVEESPDSEHPTTTNPSQEDQAPSENTLLREVSDWLAEEGIEADDEGCRKVVTQCRAHVSDWTWPEVRRVLTPLLHQVLRRSDVLSVPAYLAGVAAKYFVSERFRSARQATQETNAAAEPESNTGAWGFDLTREELERELAAETDPRLRPLIEQRLRELARKAGQA